MQVRFLKIERFRGIREFEFAPGPKTVILGPNNAGKSTILEAMDLLLHSGFGRPRPQPTEIDYYNRDPATGFQIEAVIGDLSEDLLAEVPRYLEGWNHETEEVTPEPDGAGIEPVLRIRVTGNSETDISHEYTKDEAAGTRVPPRIRAQLGWVFDGRTRDPFRELSFYQGGLLDKFFSDINMNPALTTLSEAISAGAHAVNVDNEIRARLGDLAGELHQLGLLDHEELPQFEAGAVSTRGLLQSLRLALPSADGVQIPLYRQGRGAQRLVLLTVLLQLTKKTGQTVIGGFEEPEEALEPLRQTQMARLLEGIVKERGQIFIVTHSPEIARAFFIDDFVLLEERAGGLNAHFLRKSLTEQTRQKYERKVDGAVVRALFAKIPLLVEGPGDRAVMETFWRFLADKHEVPPAEQLGLDPINCEGAGEMLAMSQLLKETGKSVAIWVEQDRPDILERLRVDGHHDALLLHDATEGRQNLEQALAQAASLPALVEALKKLAGGRGYAWNEQRQYLVSSIEGIEQNVRGMLNAAATIEEFFQALGEATTRQLVAKVLASKHVSPFEMKGARQGRIVAETILDVDNSVPESFARCFRGLSHWIQNGRPHGTEISMAE